MIIDDDRVTVSLLQTLLELDDFEVIVVARGGQVLERAQQSPPDVFLMDYHLADMTGVQVTQMLRKAPQFVHTPIVIASGLNVEDEAHKAGANLFLTKPFEPSALANILNGLIASQAKGGAAH
jgi:CheY-like chemotaxis protein